MAIPLGRVTSISKTPLTLPTAARLCYVNTWNTDTLLHNGLKVITS